MNSTTASTSGRPTTARIEVGGKTIDLPVTVGTEGEGGIDRFPCPPAIRPDELCVPIHDHLRRIKLILVQGSAVLLLAFRASRQAKGIFPTKVIPIIHMKRQRENSAAILPCVVGKFGQHLIGRRATRT